MFRPQLCREQLRRVGKSLELDRIARWIGEEHGGLFARLPLKSNMWLDDKLDLLGQTIRQTFPSLHIKHQPKVSDRHLLAIDSRGRDGCAILRGKMRNDLMTKKIEVDPTIAATAFGALKQRTIKRPRGGEIVYGKSKMKRNHKRFYAQR